MASDDDGTSSSSTGSSGRIMSAPWRPITATRRLTYARGPVTEGLEGELLKLSQQAFGRATWKRRFFMIKDGMLMYRKSKVRRRAAKRRRIEKAGTESTYFWLGRTASRSPQRCASRQT